MRRLLLPGLGAGEQVVRFRAIRRKEAKLAREVAKLTLDSLRVGNLLSVNGKTTVSLDLPVGHTCQPTVLCAAACYASGPTAATAWKKSLRKRLRNLLYFQHEETGKAVARLSKSFASKQRFWAKRGLKLDFFRINGTGDLFPELIPVLNGFAMMHPDVRVWIVTRRIELAAEVLPLPNVFLQLSLDATTPLDVEGAARQLIVTHPRAYTSFLRTKHDDDTRGAAIVFNEKKTEGLPYNRVTDCPVDSGKLSLGNKRGVGGTACSRCRKCFDERTLVRQRATREHLDVSAADAEVILASGERRRHLPLVGGSS